jgi:hypothetical protein
MSHLVARKRKRKRKRKAPWCPFSTRARPDDLTIRLHLFFYAVLGLKLRAYTSIHSTCPFWDGFFQDRVS